MTWTVSLKMCLPDELVFTKAASLLHVKIVKSLTIYSLVNLRRNRFYFSSKLLLNPIPVPRNNTRSEHRE
jgi:hypothetical protein